MRAFACLLVLGAVIAAPASAEAPGDALEKLRLLGRWSNDCAFAAASKNDLYFYTFERAGNGAQLRGGPVVRKIENVRTGPGKTIAFRLIVPPGPDEGLSTEQVIEHLGDRNRRISSVTLDGKAHIRDGVIVATGRMAGWSYRCP